MQAQWTPSFAPDGYEGPSFRRGSFMASALRDATQLRWHLFRVHADNSMERLENIEQVQEWNAAESVDFPRDWADAALAKFSGA